MFILGALIGLLAGIVAAFVRDAFDDRLRDPAALERKLGAPTLAILPDSTGRGGTGAPAAAHVTTVTRPDSQAADTFRALRTVLTSVTAGKGLCSFVVVGVDDSVSSSQVAAELGVALAESGRQTLLIAADIRGLDAARDLRRAERRRPDQHAPRQGAVQTPSPSIRLPRAETTLLAHCRQKFVAHPERPTARAAALGTRLGGHGADS